MTTTPYKITNASSTVIREELSDVIVNIDPTDTTFISNIPKGKSSSYKHEWITDTLTAATTNQKAEATTADYNAATIGTRKASYITNSAKWFSVSDIMEAMNSVDRATTLAYRTAACLKELARDIEYTAINEATGSSSDTFKTYGLKYYLPYGGAGGATNCYNFSDTQANTNLLTEALYRARCQACWTQGGKPDMVLATAAQKNYIDTFNGANRLTVNMGSDDKKVVNVVDMIETSYGVQRVYLNRNIVPSDTYYDYLFILQKDLWKYLTVIPVKTEKLGRTGTFTVVQITTTWNMEAKQEKGSACLSNLYNA
jgi:hypothetical protein